MTEEVNYDFVPKHTPIGTWLIVKVDRPKTIKIGDKEVDAESGMTKGGIFIESKVKDLQTRAAELGQVEVVVHKVGGCCFKREDLVDADGKIKEGSRIVIKQFQGRCIPDEYGKKTLYYHITENEVIGVID
jgi:hypothetical protein